VREHDLDAFDAFVTARLPYLLRLGRTLTGSERAGAVLVQDALERTLLRWSQVESEDPQGYVRQMMLKRNGSAWRRVRRARRARQAALVPEQSSEDADAGAVPADPSLWAAIGRLAPPQRAVIALRYLEDLGEADAAELLGLSPGAVRSQTRHAMERLRDLLADEPPPAEEDGG
jgi:RNA polymerase sigma factor (sigma-70 family)